MATLRYNENDQMPDYLRSASQKTLVTEDASISKFNNRMKYFPMEASAQPGAAPAVPRSSFSFGLNGAEDSKQLSLSGTPAFPSANGVPAQTATANEGGGDNWRLQGFNGASRQSFNQIKSQGLDVNGLTPVSSAPGATITSSDAYKTNPAAYHQIVSNYKPKDMTKESSLYGWGGGGQ